MQENPSAMYGKLLRFLELENAEFRLSFDALNVRKNRSDLVLTDEDRTLIAQLVVEFREEAELVSELCGVN